MTRPSLRRSAFSMIEVLVVLGLLALLAAFLFPAITRVRAAAARTQSTNNEKQLAIGCHAFHDVHKRLPFNGVKGSLANVKDIDSGSWLYQILPFIEQENLFRRPQDAEGVVIAVLRNPGRDRVGTVTEGKFKGPQSDYAINCWLNDPKQGSLNATNDRRSLVRITDGTSNTLLLGELALRTTDYKAMDGGEGRETIMIGGTMGTGRNSPKMVNDGPKIDFSHRFGGPFNGITIMSMCDGSVRAIVTNFDLQPLLSPDGGEVLKDF